MQKQSHRWIVCFLLLLVTVVNYLDRQTISVLATRIASEMNLNDWQLGRLFFGFLVAYGIGQVVLGPVLDRFSAVTALAVAVIAWSLAGAASGLATGFRFLLVTRVALGICESPNWPLGLRLITRIFPPSQRSLASGIFESGTSLSALIAPPLIIYLTVAHGWRVAFFAVGGIGFIWVALWLAWFRAHPELEPNPLPAPGKTAESSAPKSPETFREIMRSRGFWGLALATSFLNPLQYFYTTWLPRYFDKYAGVGFGAELASRLVMVYLALDLGLWSGGGLVAVLSKRWEVRRARMLVTTIGAVCMMTVPLVSQLADLDQITAVIAVAMFGLGWFMVNYLAFSAEISATRVSTAVGLLGGIGSLAGSVFMLLVGGTVERSGSFGIAFLMAGIMPLIALFGMRLGTRSILSLTT